MRIPVEFFGIPRQRAGRAACEVDLPQAGDVTTLAEVLAVLAEEFPDLARDCFDSGRLAAGFIANINGNRFISDPAAKIHAGESLLILSSDVGG